MPSTLFSTYSAGENRVTATILAVLRSLSLNRIERLLGALTEQADFVLVRFENQPARGGVGVPDAEVSSSCQILIETKIKRNAIERQQLEQHLKRLDGATESFRCLLVLTPDENRPAELANLSDEYLCWASFAALDQAVDELLTDKTEVISERESFLLRELQAMILQEGLLGFDKDTVIVAAREAWDEYINHQLYVCQPGRPFQQVQYMGFYKANQILPLVPRILERHDRVRMERGVHRGKLGEAVERLLDLNLREPMAEYGVFILSDKDDQQTTHLNEAIENDLLSDSGRRIAYTQGQRYVKLKNLLRANRTSQLITAEAQVRTQH
jgi:hypothetical protein